MDDIRSLLPDIEAALAANAGRHPGIIAEAVVARVVAAWQLLPRETHHRERRRNHAERIRRYTYEVYRVLEETGDLDPAGEIATRVSRAFLAAPHEPSDDGEGGAA